MTTAVIPFDLSKLQLASRNLAAAMPAPMGFLRMDKTGEWTHGAEQDVIPPKTEFAVNLEAFQRGYVAWADTTSGAPANKLDERMYPAFGDIPDVGDPPKGSRGWESQFGFSVRAINGKLEGTELMYRSSSDGGKRAVAALLTEAAEGAPRNPGKMPVIVLESRSYKHASYGKIYAPVFKLVRWVAQPKQASEKVPAKRKSK